MDCELSVEDIMAGQMWLREFRKSLVQQEFYAVARNFVFRLQIKHGSY